MTINKDGRAIVALEDWKRYAPPKVEHHWVDGRSAKEAARAWLEGGGSTLPPGVAAALQAHPEFGPVTSWDAEPEARIRFDDFPGEPRNSDLLVVVHDAHGPYVLAVEAKADESFSESIADALAAAIERRIQNPAPTDWRGSPR